MTPPLTSRLRESAKAMKSLDSVSLRPSTLALIDRESAARIAAELEQAADALEAGRHSGGSEGLHENRAMCDCDTSGVAGTSGNQSKGPK